MIADKLKVKKPSFEAKPWMTSFAWRIDAVLSFIFRKKREISKFSANSLHAQETISNSKIKNALNYNFQSIDNVLDEIIKNQ